MSDWQVGDLAVCVDARPSPHPRCANDDRLKVGAVYRVALVVPAADVHPLFGPVSAALHLEGKRSCSLSGGYATARFRKIRPDEHEACDPEFVEVHLKRSKVRA